MLLRSQCRCQCHEPGIKMMHIVPCCKLDPEPAIPTDPVRAQFEAQVTDAMVEAACRAAVAASRPNADPDSLTPCPRGRIGMQPIWRLYEGMMRAGIKATLAAQEGGGERVTVQYKPTPEMVKAGREKRQAGYSEIAIWYAMISAQEGTGNG